MTRDAYRSWFQPSSMNVLAKVPASWARVPNHLTRLVYNIHIFLSLSSPPPSHLSESFSQQCEELQTQRHLLCSVQTLLSLPISPYPELDYTHADIVHLNTLYCSYHNFLAFEEKYVYRNNHILIVQGVFKGTFRPPLKMVLPP